MYGEMASLRSDDINVHKMWMLEVHVLTLAMQVCLVLGCVGGERIRMVLVTTHGKPILKPAKKPRE